MASYDAQCVKCGAVQEYHRPISESHITPNCEQCSLQMVKVILTAPIGFVKGNFDSFRSPVDGSLISSQRGLREHNSRNNVVNIHDGYDEATVMSGKFNRPTDSVMTKEDRAEDIKEAIYKLEQGYKPTLEKAGADDGP